MIQRAGWGRPQSLRRARCSRCIRSPYICNRCFAGQPELIERPNTAQPKPQNLFADAKIGAPSAISGEPLEAILGTKGQAKDRFKTARRKTRKAPLRRLQIA